MGRECPVSGKKTSFGNQKTERGKAKYLGGVGKKTTGVSRRTFKPNLQRIHIWLPNGTTRYIRVATSVIRSGDVDPRGRRQGSDLPADQGGQGEAAGPRRSSRTSIRSDRGRRRVRPGQSQCRRAVQVNRSPQPHVGRSMTRSRIRTLLGVMTTNFPLGWASTLVQARQTQRSIL